MYKNLHSNLCYFHLQKKLFLTFILEEAETTLVSKDWNIDEPLHGTNQKKKKNRNKDQNLLTARHKQQTIQQFSYLISPSFLAVADPTFFAAVAVLDPASLNIVFVAAAPVLSLLYLKTQMDQNH